MLRGLIGYILGFFSCFSIMGGFYTYALDGDPSYFINSIIISVVLFIVLLFWCHYHHIKKRREYYNRFQKR